MAQKRTHKSSRKVVGLEYHSGIKFYDLFRSSKRRKIEVAIIVQTTRLQFGLLNKNYSTCF